MKSAPAAIADVTSSFVRLWEPLSQSESTPDISLLSRATNLRSSSTRILTLTGKDQPRRDLVDRTRSWTTSGFRNRAQPIPSWYAHFCGQPVETRTQRIGLARSQGSAGGNGRTAVQVDPVDPVVD